MFKINTGNFEFSWLSFYLKTVPHFNFILFYLKIVGIHNLRVLRHSKSIS